MKTLSLQQPWAMLVVLGAKRYETRSWQTSYRGPLAIHASSRVPPGIPAFCALEPFRTLFRQAGYPDGIGLPAGAIIGVVDLLDCLNVEEVRDLTPVERAVGDFRPGRWAWRLARPRRLLVPIPYRGRLGVFDGPDLPPDLLAYPSLESA